MAFARNMYTIDSSSDRNAVLLHRHWFAIIDPTHGFNRRSIRSMEFCSEWNCCINGNEICRQYCEAQEQRGTKSDKGKEKVVE
ncbi:uncharacterized protein [Gossypium hirsutum]|uniref:Uncharacterized protein isoform X4 n=1 Tax=Gossypium hirsutum TaxID=3635 RepID=A0ABM3BND2_GOSHI|nr:uncharacterized protein LOC107959981 isoform X4 [Gossypium hirsutum]